VAKTFMLRLLTPDRSVFEDMVEGVIVPGEEGELGVLAGHTRLVSTLIPGVVRYVQNDRSFSCAIGGGFVEVYRDGVTVLADSLERPEDIDVERATRAYEEAKKKLADAIKATDESILAHVQEHLTRAETRLRVAKLANQKNA
jgi:F-type H+-transporting ATPase subunit epsilon